MNQPNKTAANSANVAEFIAKVPTDRRREEAKILLDIFTRASGPL